MKKIIVAILAFLYMSTTAGATIHIHFCMGKLADWGLGHNSSKKCSKCGMEEKDAKYKGCCKDEIKFLKNSTDQKTTESAFQLIQLFAVIFPSAIVELHSNDFPFLTEVKPISNAPPRSSDMAVYIRNCVFLI